jgi:DNA-binding transcriptional regulator YiaG
MRNEKKSIGREIIEGFEEIIADMKAGVNIEAKYNCHTVTMNVEPTVYDAKRVKQTRELLSASQAVFAALLGVSVKTVSYWEQGQGVPRDVAGRFMDEIRHNPEYWRKRLREMLVVKPVGRAKSNGRKQSVRA